MTRPSRAEARRDLAVRVVKLGGSLLDWSELIARLRAWLADQSPAVHVLIVGGGALVDKLRELDAVNAFAAETSHHLAIRAMSVTAGAVAEQLPEATLVDAIEQLDLHDSKTLQILDAEQFLSQQHGTSEALPASWDVTSDSIAARVATALGAEELVLLKSCLPDGPADLESLAHSGYADAYFPRAAQSLVVRCVNLRSSDFAQVVAD
jgi:aspartokinase-like uncharacterized kinase